MQKMVFNMLKADFGTSKRKKSWLSFFGVPDEIRGLIDPDITSERDAVQKLKCPEMPSWVV
jgi:hypothetical protein